MSSLSIYLKEINRLPKLSQEQEVNYSIQIQRMMFLRSTREMLLAKLGREPMMNEWAVQAKIPEIEISVTLQKGQIAKQKMVEANLRLVVPIAVKYQNRGLELLDLIQEGAIGLQRGIERFDPTKGFRFSTYAKWWVRKAISQAVAEKGRTIYLPKDAIEKLDKIKKVEFQLFQQLGRNPTLIETATKMELKLSKIQNYLTLAQQPVSLNTRMGERGDVELCDLIEDDRHTPEEVLVKSLINQELNRLIFQLSPQEQQIIILRFGLANGQPQKLPEIASSLNLPVKTVQQIDRKALTKLYRQMNNTSDAMRSDCETVGRTF